MKLHRNAKTTPVSRALLVHRVRQEGWSVAMTAEAHGVSRQTVYRWLKRLVGYFEGLDSERAIAWLAADSLTLRDFLGLTFADAPPDHSTFRARAE